MKDEERPEAETPEAPHPEASETEERGSTEDVPKAGKEEDGSRTKKRGGGSLLADLAALLLKLGWIALVFALALLFIIGITTQRGDSMSPSFQDGDVVLFYRLNKQPDAGEPLVFRDAEGRLRVGRVVAAAGDTVEIDDLGLKINGYYQDSRYDTGQTVRFENGPDYPLTLAEGELFVLYDLRSAGGDSRSMGPLRADQVLGRVMLQLRHRSF